MEKLLRSVQLLAIFESFEAAGFSYKQQQALYQGSSCHVHIKMDGPASSPKIEKKPAKLLSSAFFSEPNLLQLALFFLQNTLD